MDKTGADAWKALFRVAHLPGVASNNIKRQTPQQLQLGKRLGGCGESRTKTTNAQIMSLTAITHVKGSMGKSLATPCAPLDGRCGHANGDDVQLRTCGEFDKGVASYFDFCNPSAYGLDIIVDQFAEQTNLKAQASHLGIHIGDVIVQLRFQDVDIFCQWSACPRSPERRRSSQWSQR